MCSFQARILWHHGSRSWNQALTRPVAHIRGRCWTKKYGTAASGLSVYDTAGAKSWDFGADGGCYTLSDAREAKEFFHKQGFVVFTDIMGNQENQAARAALVEDLHEINPATKHTTCLAQFEEADLPTSPNHTFRTTCNIAFGRFAWAVRTHPEVRRAFALLHDCEPDNLACSWDNPFYTPRADDSCSINNACTQLHWDMNKYFGGEIAPLADELCVQGVYYASPTSESTPASINGVSASTLLPAVRCTLSKILSSEIVRMH